MKKTNILKAAACMVALGVSANAYAFSGYLTDVNTTYGSASTCLICHSTAAGGGVAITSFAAQYRTALSAVALQDFDADQDGFTNKQEATAGSNMSDVAVTPFSKSIAGIGDVKLVKTMVTGDGAATELAVLDAYAYAGLTLAANEAVAGLVGVTTNVLPFTLLFADTGLDKYSAVYTVDTYTSTATMLTTVIDYTIGGNGSVTVSALPAGVAQPSAIMVTRVARAAYVAPAGGGAAANPYAAVIPVGVADTSAERTPGCLVQSNTPWYMLGFMVIIGLTMLSKQKRRNS